MACAVKNTNNNPNDEKVLYPTPLSLKIIKSLKRYGVILVVTFLFVAIAVQWKDLSNYKGNTFSYVIANRNFLFSWAIYPFREFFFFFTSTPRGCRPEDCAIDGGAPFGTQLGSHLGIVGYSNCRSETCFSFQNYSPFSEDTALGPKRKKLKGVHSGMKWQCVEYARRYWMLRGVGCEGEKLLAATFDNVDGAAEIWELSEVLLLETQRVVPMVKIRNGFGLVDDTILEVPLAKSFEGYPIEDTLPRAGDLLLYSRDPQDFPYGHVGVLVAVELNEIGQNIIHCGSPNTVDVDYLGNISIGSVFIAEQNWDNKVWVGENFSRELPLQLVSSAENRVAYMIVDEEQPVLGWKGRKDSKEMSHDSHYTHNLWHIENADLSSSCPMLYPLLDFDPPENWTKQQWGLPSSIEAFTHKREKSVEVLYTQAHQEDPLLEEWLKVEYKKEIRTEESEVDALLRNLFDTAYSTK